VDTATRKAGGLIQFQTWAARLKLKATEGPACNVNFLFLDTQHASGVTVRSGTALYEKNPLAHCDARVITTRAAFS
jgi:hypothetical protein